MDFALCEYENRLALVQREMSARKIDALLFTTEAQVRYFSGFRTQFWQSPTRPWFLVVPRAGKPIAVIPEIGAALMRGCWLDDIRTWSSPAESDDGVTLLAGALARAGTIGMMMGRETAQRMPLNDLMRLRQQISAEIVDVTEMVQRQMMVKSEAEIAKIKTICQIASDSFDNAGNLFHQGQSLRDAFRSFKIDLLQRGADDVAYLVGGKGPGGYGDVISPPDDAVIESGDVLMLDTGATLDGYFCDFDRNFAFGAASDDARQAYDTLYRATQAALDMARPGVTCAQLYTCMADIIDQGGGDVGRYGHGLGTQLTEHPSIIGFDETVLEQNMVMTLEPGMQVAEGRIMVHEENIVICDGVPQLLSRRAPAHLPVL